MLVVLIITKDKGNCSLPGMTWLFLDKLPDLLLRKEIIKMVIEEKKNFVGSRSSSGSVTLMTKNSNAVIFLFFSHILQFLQDRTDFSISVNIPIL